MEDLEKHLIKMENASKGYRCVIQPAGREAIVKEMWTKITGEDYKGQFDPEADYFVYLILRQWRRLVNTRTMEYNTERNFEQEVRYIASFMGKYVEVDAHIKELIEKHILNKSKDKIFKKTSPAVVIWWELYLRHQNSTREFDIWNIVNHNSATFRKERKIAQR